MILAHSKIFVKFLFPYSTTSYKLFLLDECRFQKKLSGIYMLVETHDAPVIQTGEIHSAEYYMLLAVF